MSRERSRKEAATSGNCVFLLNDREVSSRSPADTPLLTVLRDEFHLVGTKPGCREGDCGACTVLIGEPGNEGIRYRNVVACLTPLANVQGRHVVTIEGLNQLHLTPVQQAMVNHGGQQCGYCTPGFVVSLSQFALTGGEGGKSAAVAAMDGNICRCTGYAGIIRAAEEIADLIAEGRENANPVARAVEAGVVPAWFLGVAERLAALPPSQWQQLETGQKPVAGGTDLMVRRRWAGSGACPALAARPVGPAVRREDESLVLAAHCTGTDMLHSPDLLRALPGLPGYMKLVASTPIRNMGTVAGNLVNASPIGDYSIMLLALGAALTIKSEDGEPRSLPLEEFFLGYKSLDLAPGERITEIRFEEPGPNARFNFEKVSKRTHLDIASVNTAAEVEVVDGAIRSSRISAGGVAPVPLYLSETSRWLVGKPFEEETFRQAGERAQDEIAPISDVRGSQRYKRLLLQRLLLAHYFQMSEEAA